MHGRAILGGVLMVIAHGGLAAVASVGGTVGIAQSAESAASRVYVAAMELNGTSDAAASENSATPTPGAVETQGAGMSGGVAAAPPGTQVYRNDLPAGVDLVIHKPGSNRWMAEDLTLASGASTATYYSLRVGGLNQGGGLTFDVHTALWNGDPCDSGSLVIPGTQSNFLGIPNNQHAFDLEATLSPTIAVPGRVWLVASFSTTDSGWVSAGPAEVGATSYIWSENGVNSPQSSCGFFKFLPGCYQGSGFWASMNCNVPGDPMGACCNGITCTQTTQSGCAAGVWHGAFTTCQPNVCLAGTCCAGLNFSQCGEETQDQCACGLFNGGDTCSVEGCGPTFGAYENSFATGYYDTIATNTKMADDLKLGSGAICRLAGYEILAAGESTGPPGTFAMHVELWSNNDRGTSAESDDIPGALIPGTQFDFRNVPADGFTQRLVGGPFADIQLSQKVWMVMTTNSNKAGPIPAGPATTGLSADRFAVFNAPGYAGVWSLWDYGGFYPTGCPFNANDPSTFTCTPAGSFRIQVWCQGNPPTGACCNDMAGTCIDGARQAECNGRWAEGVGCDPDPFDPPCGVSSCCYATQILRPPNPATILCQDVTPGECDVLGQEIGSSLARGKFCSPGAAGCPTLTCLGRTGDCFTAHTGKGCEDAYCCDKVCDPVTGDHWCCDTEWDQTCATAAAAKCDRPTQNDNCADAQAISGAGTFGFDNSTATTDGPIHLACGTLGGDEQITKDVWFCWTSSCINEVLVGTCGETTVDTKVAVYDGCTCPPTDARLLDCDDDRCGGVQSMAVFNAAAGHSYLIRVGSYPGKPGGAGAIKINCGPPTNPACTGATGNCCAANTGGACNDAMCCNTVCACDPFCCATEWDGSCATTGFDGNQCGAGTLCTELCSPTCPAGAVNWLDPVSGVVDARRPYPSNDSTATEGIKLLTVQAPAGSNKVECWRLCETAVDGTPNGVDRVTNLGGGQYSITLKRPITAGAATTLTYLGGGAMATFFSHPGNVNADSASAPADILDLIDNLNGVKQLPFGMYSGDIDRSGLIAPADILEEIDLLNGAGQFRVWNGTSKPVTAGICP